MKTADKWFSIYVRLRDSNNELVKCCTCGKLIHWKESDAGHFVNRKHMSLRYSEINVNAQCRSCNRFDEGNIPSYSLFLIKKYGSEIIDKLLIAKNQTVKIDFKQIAEFYKSKAKELAKLKGIII